MRSAIFGVGTAQLEGARFAPQQMREDARYDCAKQEGRTDDRKRLREQVAAGQRWRPLEEAHEPAGRIRQRDGGPVLHAGSGPLESGAVDLVAIANTGGEIVIEMHEGD